MKKAKLIGALAAALLCVVVILQNTDPVNIYFLFKTFSMPKAILLGLTLLIGIVIGMLLDWRSARRRK